MKWLNKLSETDKWFYAGMLTVGCIWTLIEFLRYIVS